MDINNKSNDISFEDFSNFLRIYEGAMQGKGHIYILYILFKEDVFNNTNFITDLENIIDKITNKIKALELDEAVNEMRSSLEWWNSIGHSLMEEFFEREFYNNEEFKEKRLEQLIEQMEKGNHFCFENLLEKAVKGEWQAVKWMRMMVDKYKLSDFKKEMNVKEDIIQEMRYSFSISQEEFQEVIYSCMEWYKSEGLDIINNIKEYINTENNQIH